MEFTIHSLEEINKVASEFIKAIGNNKIFAFYGNMGAGKTTFIKAICEQLGVTDVVNSPTFAIVNDYALPQKGGHIFHFDFYRIKNLREVYDIGYEDYFYSDCLCFLEWPELIEELLPEETIRVNILVNDDKSRTISF